MKLTWWDHFGPLQDLHKQTFKEFEEDHPDVHVEYTWQAGETMWQSLQLARQSNQLPDIFTLAGSDYPAAALVDQDWFQPMELGKEVTDRLPEGSLVKGISVFDGKFFSFPLFSFRQYTALNWFNKDMVQKAGLDPEDPPSTYDEFRAACRKVQDSSGANGWVWDLKAPGCAQHVDDLAQAAGFEGLAGVDFRTGEFAFHSDPYRTAVEFLLSLQKDKIMVPSSTNMDGTQARLRWAAGAAAYWFEGPWCPGVVADEAPKFLDKVSVGPMLVPNEGMKVSAYVPPQGGVFWLNKNCKNPKEAVQVLAQFTTKEYAARLASNMDQPPADLSAVAGSDAHPSYKKAIEFYQKTAFLAPSAVVANNAVSEVEKNTKPIHPDFYETIVGLFSGQLGDVGTALKQLSDRAEAARAAAIKAAKKNGAKVDVDAYAFPDWKPGQDYRTR